MNDIVTLLQVWSRLEISAELRSVRLDGLIAARFCRSAAFIQASADDDVDKALDYVFSKDRDFQDFLKTPQAKQFASTLRARRGPNKDAKDEAEQLAGKLGAGVGIHDFRTGSQGVILTLSSGWSKNGASHRKKGGHVTPSWELRNAKRRFDVYAG
jgi:hypothetical protein